MCWPYPAWEMKLRPLPAEETEGVMYYDPAAMGERICNELFTWADVYDTANHDERQLQSSGAAQGCIDLRWCGDF